MTLAAQASGDAFFLELVRANDEAINPAATQQGRMFVRRIGTQLESLVAAYCCAESRWHRSAELIPLMERAAAQLVAAQHPDGTIDSGNLNSPPDTGFVLESACAALTVMRRLNDAKLGAASANVARFIQNATESQITGGVHTPNHRWVISASMARIHSLFPSPRLVKRIDEWLADGIFIDADGQFAERSTGIYSQVTDGAFVVIARVLNRPALLQPVRRNLAMNVYYMQPNGEMETVASRRQDQWQTASIARYYLEYREMAIRDRDPLFAAVTRFIESNLGAQVKSLNLLCRILEEPVLRQPLPGGSPLPENYARVFPGSGVARVRRGTKSATVYGGSDWPMGTGSGIASNPTFFTYRSGGAILDSVRMACNFFSEGFFRSTKLVARGGGYVLEQRFDVPYYQPMPAKSRSKTGDYPLTPADDNRYWSKLDFPKRPKSQVQTIVQKVTVTESNGGFDLAFDVSGHDGVPVSIEFGFRAGGQIEGGLKENGVVFLDQGDAVYRVGEDSIRVGPGVAEHRFTNLEGAPYQALNGRLKPAGPTMYITGVTPFRRTIRIA